MGCKLRRTYPNVKETSESDSLHIPPLKTNTAVPLKPVTQQSSMSQQEVATTEVRQKNIVITPLNLWSVHQDMNVSKQEQVLFPKLDLCSVKLTCLSLKPEITFVGV
ncbi:unnamed protein product [Caretta caretta]